MKTNSITEIFDETLFINVVDDPAEVSELSSLIREQNAIHPLAVKTRENSLLIQEYGDRYYQRDPSIIEPIAALLMGSDNWKKLEMISEILDIRGRDRKFRITEQPIIDGMFYMFQTGDMEEKMAGVLQRFKIPGYKDVLRQRFNSGKSTVESWLFFLLILAGDHIVLDDLEKQIGLDAIKPGMLLDFIKVLNEYFYPTGRESIESISRLVMSIYRKCPFVLKSGDDETSQEIVRVFWQLLCMYGSAEARPFMEQTIVWASQRTTKAYYEYRMSGESIYDLLEPLKSFRYDDWQWYLKFLKKADPETISEKWRKEILIHLSRVLSPGDYYSEHKVYEMYSFFKGIGYPEFIIDNISLIANKEIAGYFLKIDRIKKMSADVILKDFLDAGFFSEEDPEKIKDIIREHQQLYPDGLINKVLADMKVTFPFVDDIDDPDLPLRVDHEILSAAARCGDLLSGLSVFTHHGDTSLDTVTRASFRNKGYIMRSEDDYNYSDPIVVTSLINTILKYEGYSERIVKLDRGGFVFGDPDKIVALDLEYNFRYL